MLNIDNYSSIEGWCTEEKALKMIEYINDDTKLCVELGVFGGKSLLPIAMKCKGKVIGIDAWNKDSSLSGENDIENNNWWATIDYEYMYTYTLNLMKKYNCNNVELYRTNSSDAIQYFENESIDFLHQDSNHSELISCNEVNLYYNKVKKNGIWVFDDVNWETTKKAQELLVNYGYTEIYNHGNWKIYKRNAE